MPRICCVPQCRNYYVVGGELKFHRFPKEKSLKKQWMHQLKMFDKPTEWTLVCSDHFQDDDYIVTSLGEYKILKENRTPSQKLPVSSIDRFLDPIKKSRQKLFKERLHRLQNRSLKVEKNLPTNTDQEDSNFKPFIDTVDVSVPAHKTFVSVGTQTDKEFGKNQSTSTQTDETYMKTQATQTNSGFVNFSVSTMKDNYMHYLTGLELVRLDVIYKMLQEFRPLSDNGVVTKKDMLFFTLFKYRHNLDFKMMSVITNISTKLLSDIFNEVTAKMFLVFKQVDIWGISCSDCITYIAIIDCTEFPVESSTNPILHQLLFSYCKNRPTFKVLVGCSETGLVNFISDVFGGSISDREIVIQSGLINKLQRNQALMADRGFDISDLLEEKEILLNIPPFLRGRKQLNESEVVKTRRIANRRIIIEQVNGRAKKNRILVDVMQSSLWHPANKIIFNCFSLVNVYKPIRNT